MARDDEYRAVASRMRALLDELDRLHLSTVAVHVDLALSRLENIIAVQDRSASNLDDDGQR